MAVLIPSESGAGIGNFEFPATDGTAGQALVTNGAGVLSFATISGGSGSGGITVATFNTTNGILSLTQQDGSTVTVDLDGRYLTSFAESDPVFSASPAAGIAAPQISNWNSAFSWGDHALAGYLLSSTAATTYQPLDGDLTAIGALAGTAGLLRKAGANTWSLDTAAYLTGNQSITVSGDAAGTGTTEISLTLANTGVTASTYRSVTVDGKGRVTAGTNPTTLAGYGITDAAPLSHVGATGAAHGVATGSTAGFMAAADKAKLDGITPGATANTGTVTSVGLTVPTGLIVTNSPVTTSGTLALAYDTGYSIPTVANQTLWDSALQPADIGSTILAYDANLQAFADTLTLPETDGTNGQVLTTNGAGVLSFADILSSFAIQAAASDEVTPLTVGAAKLTFRMPYAATLTAVRASVSTAPTGANLVVDINLNGTSVLSNKLSIDAGEKTSVTAATPATIVTTALPDDGEITIDIDQVGATFAGTGLKVTLVISV